MHFVGARLGRRYTRIQLACLVSEGLLAGSHVLVEFLEPGVLVPQKDHILLLMIGAARLLAALKIRVQLSVLSSQIFDLSADLVHARTEALLHELFLLEGSLELALGVTELHFNVLTLLYLSD